MFDEETMKAYWKACDEAHSHLEAPLLWKAITPICSSCKYADYSDAWNLKCEKYGDIPRDYNAGRDYDCPEYEIKPNCPKEDLPTPPEER